VTVEQTIDHAVAVGKQGRLSDAELMLREVVAAYPTHPRAYANLGVALQMQDKHDEALTAVRRSLELRADSASTHLSHAKLLLRMARPADAVDACRAALRLTPDDAETHGTLARALLTAGDFKHGWIEYEWRWKCESFNEDRREFSQPRYAGGKIAGKTILIHHEQGFGDTMQFVRYADVLAARGAVVLVQCPTELAELIRRMPSVAGVNPQRQVAESFDCHIPMMSLPLACNTTTPKLIPASVPYLTPPAKLVEAWRERVRRDGPAKLRVGIAWAGRPQHLDDKYRTLSLAQFGPIAQAAGDGVIFYSLQKWDAAAEGASPPPGLRLIDTGPKLFDFADTAALIANLDLVITVDTAVAHLAGAMAKPVWTFIPFAPDFRWMLARADTPWYPTMRLLRQQRTSDWSGPIAEAAARLRDLAVAAAAAGVQSYNGLADSRGSPV
jgi:tetratricopeptide (TPR) repeat protein